MKYKFTKKEAFPINWDGINAFNYTSEKDLSSASVIVFEVNNTNHGQIKTTVSDRIYYIFEGSGEFIISDKIIPVESTDVVIVPKNTPYDYQGTMKLFLVHVPPYDPGGEVILEPKQGREVA